MMMAWLIQAMNPLPATPGLLMRGKELIVSWDHAELAQHVVWGVVLLRKQWLQFPLRIELK
jgi:hypothetical protein